MAQYGGLLTTTSGEVWVTANSSPIALQARKTAALQGTSGFNTKVTHTFPSGQPVVAFVHCTVEVEITQTVSGNTITIDFLRPNATGTAYGRVGCIGDPDFNPRDAHARRCRYHRNCRSRCKLRLQHQHNPGGEVGLHARHARPDYRGYISRWPAAALRCNLQEHGKTRGKQYADICQTSDNPLRRAAKRRVLKHEKRHHGHQLRQLRLIVFSDQFLIIDLPNQLYPVDSYCYCVT